MIAHLAMLLAIVAFLASAPVRADSPIPNFEQDIRPILAKHCHACHGEDAQESKLDLRTVNGMLQGGANGPAIVRHQPNASLLVELLNKGEMPPEGEAKLSADEVALITRWIEAGTPAEEPIVEPAPTPMIRPEDRRHWAFQQPIKQPTPEVQHADRVRTPIDAFMLGRLEAQGLSFSPDADRLTLMRRVYFDLIGLPPALEEIDAFLSDARPNAYEQLIDQLLESPHFGERWGRHWLDIVGYTDTVSYDGDLSPIYGSTEGKWQYRDYVVRSFNRDTPYDRFLAQQLAGDELVDWRNAPKYSPEILDHLVATGFWRTAEDISDADPRAVIRWSVVHDAIRTFGTAILGLTIHCAQCHNHKYEPIPQQDYYQLMALISPAYNMENWKGPEARNLPDVSAADRAQIDQHNAARDREVADLNNRIAELRRPHETRLREPKLATISEPIRADTKEAYDTPADKRNEVQKYLAGKFEALLAVKPEEVDPILPPGEKVNLDVFQKQIAETNNKRRSFGKIHALYDVGPPPTTFLLKRGDFQTPGREVLPGFLTVLSDSQAPVLLASLQSDVTSGRRAALARWLTDRELPASGLAARVMVNRVWQHLTGQGIASTSENLGASGAPPTHPELLDWLAADFVESGWRVKALIKQIMMSTAYRQASYQAPGDMDSAADPLAIDPDNKLLWRMRLRRLESEAIRDAMLAVSGALDRTMGGPPIRFNYQPDGMAVVSENELPTPTAKWRRSLYLFARRNIHPTLLGVFDQPSVASSNCRRVCSAVTLQSLTMMNDAGVLEQAAQLADRVISTAGDSKEQQMELAFRLALARKPTPDEVQWSEELLDEQTKLYKDTGLPAEQADQRALEHLCVTLFNTSEFLYIE